VVLAGGQDSRLGGAGTATVEVAGRPLLAYVLEAMTGALDEVAVAAKASNALPVALWPEPDEPPPPARRPA
jgi:GTP:adenosylcobinamide-phosphate guanylyltransferase